jgi:hypothetical protein
MPALIDKQASGTTPIKKIEVVYDQLADIARIRQELIDGALTVY